MIKPTFYLKTPIAFYNLPHGGCKVVYDCRAMMEGKPLHFRHELTYRVMPTSGEIFTRSQVIPIHDEVES